MNVSFRSTGRRVACETRRKRQRALQSLAAIGALWLVLSAGPAAVRAAQSEPSATAAGEAAHEEPGGRGIVDVVARIVNFGILAGTLVYLLRSPLATYLGDRSAQIRHDLVNADEMKRAAAAQIEDIDRRMKALPGELEALRQQGAREIAAEEERIRVAAGAERDRLLEQARREIDLQVKVAERELVSHAAELAVGLASERIKKNITDDDQKRLVDRYVAQLRQ
jgi:F-type H+-transporting ATPase subunit b